MAWVGVAVALFSHAAAAQQLAEISPGPGEIDAVADAFDVAPVAPDVPQVRKPRQLPYAFTPVPVVVVAPSPIVEAAPSVEVKTPVRYADLWQRIRAGFQLDELASPMVAAQADAFADRPESIKRIVERSRRYLYFIVEAIETRGMPTEIALLPVIESAFNPTAYSSAHASGIWQFIPSTGKNYGLNQDFWYDGRRDVLAATDAALDYLEKLHAQFNSWELALAAYNWGEGAVERAVAKNVAKGLPTDYLSLAMPAETRGYVPKLLAVKNLIADPAKYGIALPAVANEPYFAVVTTQRPLDVKLAAKLADVPLAEFVALNAGHMRPVIRATNRSQSLLVPVDRVERFQANLASHDDAFVSWQIHTVQHGEQPASVAKRYGTSVAVLKEVNGDRKFTAGTPVLVPFDGVRGAHLPDLPAVEVAIAKMPAATPVAPVRVSSKSTRAERSGRVLARFAPGRAGTYSQNGLQKTRADTPSKSLLGKSTAKLAPARAKLAGTLAVAQKVRFR